MGENVFVAWWEKVVLYALKMWPRIVELADIDKDGDVDSDDLYALYVWLKEWLPKAASTVAGWEGMTKGQKIDACGQALKAAFPNVPGTLWVALEGLAWLALSLQAKGK